VFSTRAEAAPLAYVTRADVVSVIDTSTKQVVNNIPIGFGAQAIEVTPNGRLAYLLDPSFVVLRVLDLATGAMTASDPVGNEAARLVIGADGARAYVMAQDLASVLVIDTATHKVTNSVYPGPDRFLQQRAIAVRPDGAVIYAAQAIPESGTEMILFVIDTATLALTEMTVPGGNPQRIAFSPDGSLVYITHGLGITVIDAATHQSTGTITLSVGASADDVAFTSDGAVAYVTAFGGPLAIVNTTEEREVATIPLPGPATAVAITPDGASISPPHQLRRQPRVYLYVRNVPAPATATAMAR